MESVKKERSIKLCVEGDMKDWHCDVENNITERFTPLEIIGAYYNKLMTIKNMKENLKQGWDNIVKTIESERDKLNPRVDEEYKYINEELAPNSEKILKKMPNGKYAFNLGKDIFTKKQAMKEINQALKDIATVDKTINELKEKTKKCLE